MDELFAELEKLSDAARGFFLRLYPLLMNAHPPGQLTQSNQELALALEMDYSTLCRRLAELEEVKVFRRNMSNGVYCPVVIRIIVNRAYWDAHERRGNERRK